MPRRSAPSSLARRLGARVRAFREEAKITQEALAWDCGFAKSYLSQLEAGKVVPSLAALRALAKRLDVDALVLFACDSTKPLHALVDAAHRKDRKRVELALKRLGVD
jgi:transcriptional regulator with XRE-family HTH domain